MVDFVFIDSGTGGLPYLAHMKEVCPGAVCAYVGDTANFPYGEKSHEQIVDAVLSLCKKIIQKLDPKVIVVACNTMSVNTLDVLREAFPDTLFVGTVPAIKVAGEISKKRRIGLMATRSCVEHPYNQDLKKHFASDCELVLRADPELIAFIEHESFTATQQECEAACKPAVDFFTKENCDVIILGCTHFLNLSQTIQNVAGNDIKVIDSKEGVVKRALSLHQPASKTDSVAELYVTGFADEKDQKEYDAVCKKYNLHFCGLF